jgi:hypothetical protein
MWWHKKDSFLHYLENPKPQFIVSVVLQRLQNTSLSDVGITNWVKIVDAVSEDEAKGMAYTQALETYKDHRIITLAVLAI